MRATIGQLRRHPEYLGSWWIDLPARNRWWWRQLLFEPGAGWLTWKHDYRSTMCYDPPDFDEWAVYPPLRRAWLFLHAWLMHAPLVMQGECRWSETPSWSDVPRDERHTP